MSETKTIEKPPDDDEVFETVELPTETGPVECVILATIDHGGETYALLTKSDDLDMDAGNETTTVFVLRLRRLPEGLEFQEVANETLWHILQQRFEALLDRRASEETGKSMLTHTVMARDN